MSKRIWIRLVAWTALLIVVIVLKFLPFGGKQAEPPVGVIDTTAKLVSRPATAAEWEAPLQELGRHRLARQVTVIAVRRGAGEGRLADRVARGQLLRYDPGDGMRLAYIAHPDELSDRRSAADVWRSLKQAAGFGQAFIAAGALPPLGPEDLDRLPVDFQLDEGWTMLTAPPREPEAGPAPAGAPASEPKASPAPAPASEPKASRAPAPEGATTKDAKATK